MKKYIRGCVYNTDTARLLTSVIERENPMIDPGTEVELYRKKSGEYFYHYIPEEGGSKAEKIIPTTRERAAAWLKTHFTDDEVRAILMPLRTRQGSKVKMNIPFDPKLKARMMESADSLKKSQVSFILDAVKLAIHAQEVGLDINKVTKEDLENVKTFVDERPDCIFF